jgi:acyl carrier protein
VGTINGLKQVFEDTFATQFPQFDAATSQADVELWDSAHHVKLLLAIEEHFAIRFTSAELENLDSVGAICDVIEAKRRGQ